ncbi:hypothetical protein AXF42_Ash010238 [Apostasia shenzhenica]|uniref:Serine/threonine-protein phosphatase 6 regulatory subunit 3 n=1 Tax=Apostasia shenzhenica TaxID=1088818 RepID=A0A2I0A9W4_9ASPA|nr:hypothetical protein AXF42_Ash010238 [Apostasia shenzhenica]
MNCLTLCFIVFPLSCRFPFVACEIFTCEVDIILRTLVEDEELMDLLFSFLKPDHPHGSLLAGYFSKVVLCLMARKSVDLMSYVQGHQEIFHQLVDLIGITSIMEVLIRLIGADEIMYSNYTYKFQWLDDIEILDLIVDKFSSSDLPEVHANTAEVLCAVTRCAPSTLAAKICSPSFVGRLLSHTLDDSRPRSVLIHSLSVCISFLDPMKSLPSSYQSFRSQLSHGIMVSPETVDGMLESLGGLLKLLDTSTSELSLPTTYGYLKPPLGKHRLKIVEFIAVLLTIGTEAIEESLIRLGAVSRMLDLFVEYPYNNFLHHQVENIVASCIESERPLLLEHLLQDCDIVSKILGAEKQPTVSPDSNKSTVAAEGRLPPRIGNIGHLTRIANKLLQAANTSSTVHIHLQENCDWDDWHANVLVKRNALENVYNWACGRPSSLQDRARDSDDEDFRDRDYDVAALASNLSQAFRCNIYDHDEIDEPHGSVDRDDEDVYFDDESAEVVISSLRLGDDQDSGSLFTNSNWFAYESDRSVNNRATGSVASPSPNSGNSDELVVSANEELVDNPTFIEVYGSKSKFSETGNLILGNGSSEEPKEHSTNPLCEIDKLPEWVDWRDTNPTSSIPNGDHDHDEILDSGKCLKTSRGFEATNGEGEKSLVSKSSAPMICDSTTVSNGKEGVK